MERLVLNYLAESACLEVHYGGEPLLSIPLLHLAVALTPRVSVRRFIAWDFFREIGKSRHRMRYVISHSARNDRFEAQLGHVATVPLLQVVFEIDDEHHLHFRFTAEPGHHRIQWVWHGPPNEVLFGFGAHGTGPRTPDGRFASWSEEGPVGLGPLSRWLRWTGRVPIPKGPMAGYVSLPQWLSSRGYAAWLNGYERVVWKIHRRSRTAESWSSVMDGDLVVGVSLVDVLERQNSRLGPPPTPPPWIFAPWNDAVRGRDRVEALASRLREHRIPSSAIWVEDWMGSWEDSRRFWMRPLSHRLDAELYPDFSGMAHQLHNQGFRLLGYFCPEVTEGTALYERALAGEHLMVNAKGLPVRINILGVWHGQWDLTRSKTRRFVQEELLGPAERLGFDGWMADFGEYLPVDAQLADGRTGFQAHNQYPLLWQNLHRSFWESTRPDGDWVFFVRSASMGSQAVAPVVWGGDQDTDFDRADGLPSVVPLMLSAGLSGFPHWGSDLGGYMTFGLTQPRSRELFWRWTELAALTPVMRTHHGTASPRNWHFDSDRDTTEHYARYARLHTLLFPYWHHLASIARHRGLPIARPVFLHYPGQETWDLGNQYLLGEDLLVAPILERGQDKRPVYIPDGVWIHWWNGEKRVGPGTLRLPAPLGAIPLFIREGALLPLHEGGIDRTGSRPHTVGFLDTLTTDAVDGLTGLSTRGPLTLLITAGLKGSGQIHLWPEGSLSWSVAENQPLNAPEIDTSSVGGPRWHDHAPLLTGQGDVGQLNPKETSIYRLPHGLLQLTLNRYPSTLTIIFRTLS